MEAPTSTKNAPPPAATANGPQMARQIRDETHHIRAELKRLRLDEMASIAQRHDVDFGDTVIGRQVSWIRLAISDFFCLFRYLWFTWGTILLNIFNNEIDIGDRFSMIVFAFGASTILSVTYIWCFVSNNPIVVWIYELLFGKESDGLGLVNSMNPHLFKNMTEDQAEAAKEKLSEAPDLDAYEDRAFSLDIAKMLLQISSLMYERSHRDTLKAFENIRSHITKTSTLKDSSGAIPLFDLFPIHLAESADTPGELFAALVKDKNISATADSVAAIERKSRSEMDKWATKYGICYEPISELASLNQAYVSIFWDPTSTWIVVAFKGTDPRSFGEWVTDFTASYDNARDDIPGFHMVHKGFKERIFPSYLGIGQRKPWTSISTAIKIVAEGLGKYRDPGTKINLWFTGHSLGTALATLAYSKALISHEELPENVVLRDAYLFATPITTDAPTRYHFDEMVYSTDAKVPRTMWRVTNRDDFVATGLPALGDIDKYKFDKNNLFGFSHLGIEIFMKSGPRASEVAGNLVKNNGPFKVHISSKFLAKEIIAQRELAVSSNLTLSKMYSRLQNIPIIGRLAAHATVNYYDQLDQIALAPCVDRQ